MKNKKGQVTIFIIIAIVLIAAVGLYFLFKETLTQEQIPVSLQPVYTSFLSCLEEQTNAGIGILKIQGGYIYLPELELGSHYYPFSSQLDFLGNNIPYWYYLSGNGLEKEQIPSLEQMEQDLSRFIQERARDCDFNDYYFQGFKVFQEPPEVEISIKDNSIDVNVDMDMTLEYGDDSALVRNHGVTIDSDLGNLYQSAKEVYNYEQESLFLENYSIDTLRLYAPVDGIEISCSPSVWGVDEVFDNLQIALEQNTIVLGSNLGEGYFDVDLPIEQEVKFITSRNWPSTFEVNPSEENILIAKPVGNQQGLGILGFCYVPYHFVYNVRYPVLVQVGNIENGEFFQFPVAVLIEGNHPRKALQTTAGISNAPELCQYKNTNVQVNTYDINLNPVEADISYRCFSETCQIGATNNGVLEEDFPQCVNGYVVAKAQGYEQANTLYSTVEDGVVNVFLQKSHNLDIILKLDGREYNGEAVISIIKDSGISKTIVYPEQKQVSLGQGQYELQVYIYKNSSLEFPETTKTECIEVPSGGIAGVIGLTAEKCFDVTIPSQIISNVLAGGGKQNYYALDSELASSSILEINAGSLPTPTSLEEIQTNYILFESKNIRVNLI